MRRPARRNTNPSEYRQRPLLVPRQRVAHIGRPDSASPQDGQPPKKAEIIELVLRLAGEEKFCTWTLERELGLDKPIALLVHDVEVAIKLATKVDELQLNHNFDYDWQAYEAIQVGLVQLIEKNALDEAKALALKLMCAGSYQIECSDEGLMREEIEGCLRLVISAVAGTSDGRDWALEMHSRDRVGFLCELELKELAGLVL